ncbi:MAG: hypothetical protein RLZ63_1417 [Pseudomonadota bacterium]|jgi:hypothetical protein
MSDELQEIAAVAARLVVEDGLRFGPAKTHALRQLGLPGRTALPSNDELEDAVREHLELFHADRHAEHLRQLRQLALRWMQRLQAFDPYLTGAVWLGYASQLSDVDLDLYVDDTKSVEIELINQGVAYDAGQMDVGRREPVSVLHVMDRVQGWTHGVSVYMRVHDRGAMRGALLPDGKGRTPRGNAMAVQALLDAQEGVDQ